MGSDVAEMVNTFGQKGAKTITWQMMGHTGKRPGANLGTIWRRKLPKDVCLLIDVDINKVEKINRGTLPIPELKSWFGFDIKKLQEISSKINTIPKKINLHKTISKILDNRKLNVKIGKNIDWSTAEALAFGSLLEEGYPVRLVGQDSGLNLGLEQHDQVG